MKRWLLGKFGWYVVIVAAALLIVGPKDAASLNGTAVTTVATSGGIVVGGLSEAGPSFQDGMDLMKPASEKKG